MRTLQSKTNFIRRPDNFTWNFTLSQAMKFGLYVLVTLALTGMVVYNAVQSRKQFYNAAIFLTTSKFNLVVIGNLGFLMLLSMGKFVKAVFLGSLTRTELEDLEQNARFTMVETCFALWAVFREDLNLKVLVLFATLLFVKIFHWLAIMRVDNVGQSQDLPLSTHLRLQALFGLLSFVDVCCVVTITSYLFAQRTASMLILLDFEYLILCVTVVGVAGKYALWVIDSRTPGGWANRSAWMFYLDVTTDVIRLFFYLVFFLVVTVYYGLPLHLIRELYMTIYNLRDRVTKFIHYRKLTRNMNERFPDATQEELQAGDRTCIVCREDMVVGKKLPCNHIFHFHCLRSWLEQHHNCPMCRAVIPIHAVPPQRNMRAAAEQQQRQQPPQQPPQQQPQQQQPPHQHQPPPQHHQHHQHHHHHHQQQPQPQQEPPPPPHHHHHHHHPPATPAAAPTTHSSSQAILAALRALHQQQQPTAVPETLRHYMPASSSSTTSAVSSTTTSSSTSSSSAAASFFSSSSLPPHTHSGVGSPFDHAGHTSTLRQRFPPGLPPPPPPPPFFPPFMGSPFGMPFAVPSATAAGPAWQDGLQQQSKLLQDHIMFLQHQLAQANLMHQQLQLQIHASAAATASAMPAPATPSPTAAVATPSPVATPSSAAGSTPSPAAAAATASATLFPATTASAAAVFPAVATAATPSVVAAVGTPSPAITAATSSGVEAAPASPAASPTAASDPPAESLAVSSESPVASADFPPSA